MIRSATFALCLLAAPFAMAEEVSGLLEPVKSVQLRPEVDAAIVEVATREGDQVAAGRLLIRLDDAVQTARVAVAAGAPADARIERAAVSVESARSLLERIERAAKRGGAPKWEVAEARFRLREAEADLRLAEDLKTADAAREALERASLGQYAILAPFDGVVTEVQAAEGETAARSEPLLTLEDFSSLEAVVFAPVASMSDLEVGATYAARVGAPVDREVDATLRFVEPRIDPASGTVRAIFVVDNTALRAPAGVDLYVDPARKR